MSEVKLLQDAMDDLSLQNFELENLKDEIMAEIADRDLEISQRTDGLTESVWKKWLKWKIPAGNNIIFKRQKDLSSSLTKTVDTFELTTSNFIDTFQGQFDENKKERAEARDR